MIRNQKTAALRICGATLTFSLLAAGAVPARIVPATVFSQSPIVGVPALTQPPALGGAPAAVSALRGKPKLERVLTSADGGQIYGFDINQHGDDGLLASAQDVSPPGNFLVSVETFNQNTGNITRSFAKYRGPKHSYLVNGIFANDVGLVTHYVIQSNGFAHRDYDVLGPVSGNRFTQEWAPPVAEQDVVQSAENQTTSTSLLLAIELRNDDRPDLIVSDILKNTFPNVIQLDPNQFGGANGPQLAQDTVHDKAILATSLDGGAAGGPPPTVAIVDLTSGRIVEFPGVNCPGWVGCGSADGIAYDSQSGIACTTTALDAGVEIYDVARHAGFRRQLPGRGQFYAGSSITSDPLHRLFLIFQGNTGTGPSGTSSIQVYGENGTFVESIDGIGSGGTLSVVPVRIAINPKKRMGWVNGPNLNQLQQFSY